MRYVLVAADGYDKNIAGGPFDVDDPSQLAVPEGQRLMSEDDAFAAGFHYAEGGGAGFAADRGGDGEQGAQGQEGGQGAQVQPGGQDRQ